MTSFTVFICSIGLAILLVYASACIEEHLIDIKNELKKLNGEKPDETE